MKQQRTLIVLAVAVITAGIAAYGVSNAIQRMPVREVEIGTVPVVVATQAIPVGTRLTKEQLRVIAWPAKNPVPGAFADVQSVVNRGVISTLGENEPVTSYKVAGPEAGAGLPPVIPQGMRAVSVRVNEVVGVAGFVMPGTHVDVIVSVADDGAGRGGGGGAMARTVVSNVLVLTAGTRYDRQDPKNTQPQPTTVVTLAVIPEDGERIALAMQHGNISLALRNPVDVDPTKTQGIRLAALMRAPGDQPVIDVKENRVVRPRIIQQVVAAPPPPVVPAVYRVETIRAAKRTEEVVH
jgi:pilus assembly protein CpaB